MATINTIDMRVKNAKVFRESLYAENSYISTAKDTPWEDDRNPPKPNSSLGEFYQFWKDNNFLRQITKDETMLLVPRITWVANVVYDVYRHDYSVDNRTFSGKNSLLDARFYVINSQNIVYVCLDNGNNTTSKIEPRDGDDKPFRTIDGYQWLKLYKITSNDLKNYSTDNYIPVTLNDAETQTDGAVFSVIINNAGNNYANSPIGTPSKRPYYYCRIVGDGSGAIARVEVKGGRITRVDVISYGQKYTDGELMFKKGFVHKSVDDLRNDVDPIDPGGDGTLDTTVVIQPPGGWGSDLERQLCARRVGVFCDLTSKINLSDFRQIGVLQDVESDADGNEIKNSGVLTYLSNSSPITRSANETIKASLLISF